MNFLIFEVSFLAAYAAGMAFPEEHPAPLWFPDAVLLSALLLSRPSTWWIYLLLPLPVRLLVSVPDGPIWFLPVMYLNDSLKALLSALCIRIFTKPEAICNSLRGFRIYAIYGVVVFPAQSAIAGAATWAALGKQFWPVASQWFLGDALANLLLTPFIICFAQCIREIPGAVRRYWWEAGMTLAALIACCSAAFNHTIEFGNSYPPYLPIPVLLWASNRFRMIGAVGGLLIMSIFAIRAADAPSAFLLAHSGNPIQSTQLMLLVISAPILLFAVVTEEQRNTQIALRMSEGRFRALLNSAPLMVWMSDSDGNWTFVNKSFIDFTGLSQNLLLGRGWMESVHPQDRERLLTILQRPGIRDAAEISLEYRLRRHDGVYRWIYISIGHQQASQDDFLGYIASCVDVTERRDAEEKLRRSEKVLREFSARLIHIQEAERRRIGQELHDDLAQRAAALSIGLTAVAFGRDPERLEKLRSQAGELCNDISMLSHRFHPATLERIGLPVALRNLCEESSNPASTAVQFVQHGTARPIPWLISVSFYRVAQEALRNALKHSGAGVVVVRLTTAQDELILEIADNGKGFSPESHAITGLGIAGMTERMRAIGGMVVVRSTPKRGATVIASVRDVGSVQ